MKLAQFGPGGNPDDFYQSGRKDSVDMPAWLRQMSLTAYEYQCSRGVRIGETTARAIGKAAAACAISLSIHAPYYINLATEDEKIARNTQNHLLKSLEAARWMGADRVVFHAGSPGSDRKAALERAKKLLSTVLETAEQRGLNDILLAPETMGKKNQLGNLTEVIELCKLSDRMIPAIDFGHLHAVTCGLYTTKAEILSVFETVGASLGETIAQNIHIHFSRIEFTPAGERKHWTFDDPFGPPFEPLIECIAENGYTPRIICESAGTQARDAKIMQDYYVKMSNR